MKLLSSFLVFVFLLSCTTNAQEKKNPIEGTWELVSNTLPSADSSNSDPVNDYYRQIKIINQTHFVWIEQDTSGEGSSGFGGGKYTLDGDNYTEHIEMFIAPIWIGKSIPFKIKIEGDTLILSGKVPLKKLGIADSDQEHYEVWKRID